MEKCVLCELPLIVHFYNCIVSVIFAGFCIQADRRQHHNVNKKYCTVKWI